MARPWVSTAVAAARLQYTDRAIRARCAAGDVPATKVWEGGTWRVSRAWLDSVAPTSPKTAGGY